MPGSAELQLISRYFGAPTASALRSLTGIEGAKLAQDALAAAGNHSKQQHAHHHHAHKVHPVPKKHSSSEEELMQGLFKKL